VTQPLPAQLLPPLPPKPPPQPVASDDTWAIALAEMLPTLAGPARSFLTGSCMEDGGTAPDGNGDLKRICRIVVEDRAADSVGWLTTQAGYTIRRKLSSLLKEPVLIEIVAAATPAAPIAAAVAAVERAP
jgi:hypothetical protein